MNERFSMPIILFRISSLFSFQYLKNFAVLTAIFLCFGNASQFFAQNSVCKLENADRLWIEQTLEIWEKVRKNSLQISDAKMPWLILFDEACVFNVNPDFSVFTNTKTEKSKISFNRKSVDILTVNHKGKITLPEKGEIPAQLISFAASYNKGQKSFLVSAMPQIWRKAPHLQAERNIDILVRSVFVHEMMHTFHHNYHAKLDIIEKKLVGVENFDDDIVQNIFSKNADFRAAYEKEHDLLYKAVGENDLTRKRELAKTAFEMIKMRRKQFFVNENKIYEEIEEIFLTMEGAANWAAYRSAIDQGLSETDALKLIRRSGNYWSQDESVALFLVIDSLFSGWSKKAFGKSQTSVTELLAEAVK